jgi:hypothetical protein
MRTDKHWELFSRLNSFKFKNKFRSNHEFLKFLTFGSFDSTELIEIEKLLFVNSCYFYQKYSI